MRSLLVGTPHDATPSAHDHIAMYKRIGMAVPRIVQRRNSTVDRTVSADAGSHPRSRPPRNFFALSLELWARWRYARLKCLTAARRGTPHPLLEDLVADREHMVAPGDIERSARRQQGRKLVRRARDRVLGADRDQHRRADGRDLLARQASDANRECRPRAPSGRIWSVRRTRGTRGPRDRVHRPARAPRALPRCSRAVRPRRPGGLPRPPSTAYGAGAAGCASAKNAAMRAPME